MRKLLILPALLLALSLFSQKTTLDLFSDMKPRNIGPAGMSGRITSVDVVISNPNIIYVGSASGGVWKTVNGGAEWQPVFEDQPLLNIGALAIQQSNPNVVWVGTGEGNPRNSLNLGGGIFRSLDAGRTWQRMGLEKTICIHRIVIDPVNPSTVYVAAIGNPFSEHPERGVYKTMNGGETWEKILYVNDSTGCADLVMDPSNPNKLIASMWQHKRTPWSMKSGGAGSGLYITIDGGKNWKRMSSNDGLPKGELGRIGIAFARSMPSRVYAKVEADKNGLYRSDDGGFSWKLINSKASEVTDRPFYYQEIYVDPKNENRIYDVHSTVTLSEDGGLNFRTLIPYSGIHPDHHAWWIHPENPDFIVEGNDGGIGISRDRGEHWIFDEKIPVGQFYHVSVDDQMPYNVMGGMQDNGSWHGPAYTFTNGGLRNFYWHNIGGGDGFDVMPDAEDPNWVYSMSQGGNVGRRNVETGESWFIKPPSVDPNIPLRFNWNAAIAQDPFDKKTIYYGSQFLHRSRNKGASWETISPDLTTNDSAKIDQSQTGGLTLDITGAENHCTILAIAPSPLQQGVIWVGTDDGNLQLTRDGGKTWTNFRGKIPGMPEGSWIPQVKASRYNAGEAFVVVNDYRRGDMKPYLFRTKDYGKSWTRMIDEKKVRGYALSVIQDPVEPNLIFLGTEHGLWVSLDNGKTFEQWKHGYPSVSTYDLAIQEREADLVIGTFGRALWVLDNIRPLRRAANTPLDKPLVVFSAPPAYQAQYRPAPGYDWSTWGLWSAENRRRGAAVDYFVQPSLITDKKVKHDSVTVKIFNNNNEQIRMLRWRADTGYNRGYWGMDEKGFRYPGSPAQGPKAPEPGGMQVLPGDYKLVMELGNSKDSTIVTVLDDPRLGNRNDIKLAQRRLYDRLRESTDKLTIAMDRLRESDNAIEKVEEMLKGESGAVVDSLRKTTRAIKDSLKDIREFINGKPAIRQGISRNPLERTVMSTLQDASRNIVSKSIAPGEQEEQLVKNAEDMIAEVVRRIDQFFANNWEEYRKQVEAAKIQPVKSYDPLVP